MSATNVGPAKAVDMSVLAEAMQQKAQEKENQTKAAIVNATAEAAASANGDLTVKSRLEKLRPYLKAMMPQSQQTDANVDRVLNLLTLAMMEDPKLMYCDNTSLFRAAAKAIAYGLEPGRELKECSIWAEEHGGQWRAGFTILKKGLIKHMIRSGNIAKIEADVVREGDTFDYVQGTDIRLTHTKNIFGEPGKIVGAYAIATFTDGSKQVYVERRSIIDKEHRAYARYPEYWEQFETDAYITAVLRELWKQLPSTVLDSALAELAEEDEPVPGITDDVAFEAAEQVDE